MNNQNTFDKKDISIEKIILIDKHLKDYEWALIWNKKDISDYYGMLIIFIIIISLLLFFNNIICFIKIIKNKIDKKKEYKYLQKVKDNIETKEIDILKKDINSIKNTFNKNYISIINNQISFSVIISFIICGLYLMGYKKEYIKVLKEQEPELFSFLLHYKEQEQLNDENKNILQSFYKKISNGN